MLKCASFQRGLKERSYLISAKQTVYANYPRMPPSLDYVFYASLFLFTTGVTGKITNTPLNSVVEVGGEASFSCTSDTILQNWEFSTNREEVEASTGQIIAIKCVVQSGFTTHYEVGRPQGSNRRCTLIVNAPTMQEAGVYTRTDNAGPGTSAILTVIDRDASITVSSQSETVEGDRVTMSYTVRYNTSTASTKTPTIQPVLTWTDSDRITVTSSLSSTANSVTSSISVTAGRQDIRPYACRISFEIKWPSPSTGLSFARDTYTRISDSASTSTINVLYAPIISNIMTSQEIPVCPNITVTVVNITCHATANPAPAYAWIGPDSRTYSGATIEAVMDGVYTCNASNVIRGSVRSDTKETTLIEDCAQDDQTDPSDIVYIIVCSVVGAYILGNIIATVLFLIYYNRNIGFKRKLNDRFSWLRKMLSCMNEDVTCGCGWIFLSVCVFTLAGILLTISLVLIAKVSQGHRRSQNTVPHFHNTSYIGHSGESDEIVQHSTMGANGEDAYEKLRVGRRSAFQGNDINNEDKEKQQNGKENGQPMSAKKNTNQSPPNADNVSTTPSSPPPNQQPTTPQGPVYSDIPVTNHNVQPEQYIEGNMDNNYSEPKKT